jgi:hypothetical protein
MLIHDITVEEWKQKVFKKFQIRLELNEKENFYCFHFK